MFLKCVLIHHENLIWHMGAYAPATGKNISKSQKISRVRLDILCVHAKFHEKLTLLCLL
jgi:hypothetical protein